MKKEIADKWVEALRSGKYKQTREGVLRTKDKKEYCCLGVLCKLIDPSILRQIDLHTSELPDNVALKSQSKCHIKFDNINAAGLNDSGFVEYNDLDQETRIEALTFDEIADLIQINYEDL